MPIDGFFIHKLLCELKEIEKSRVRKINPLNTSDIVFSLYKDSSLELLISLNPVFPRLHLQKEKKYVIEKQNTPFLNLLKRTLEGAIFNNFEQYENDRIIVMTFTKINELGELKTYELIFEITGRHANLVLTAERKILDAYKRFLPSENSRTILPNALYEFFNQNNKFNPYKISDEALKRLIAENINPPALFSKQNFSGISDLFCEAVGDFSNYLNNFKSLLQETKPVILELNNKTDLYFAPVSGYKILQEFSTLNELMETYAKISLTSFAGNSQKNLLETTLLKKKKKLMQKITELEKELAGSKNAFEYRKKGELLLQSSFNLNEKKSEIILFDYIADKDIEIELDSKYTLKENALYFFKIYRKKNLSISHIDSQIEKAFEEIEYIDTLLCQIAIAENPDLEEIQAELAQKGYILASKKSHSKKKAPLFRRFSLKNGIEILVGKNNMQNELLIKNAAKNAYWFHVLNAPSAHVIVQTEKELDEYTIRTSALITIYYSAYKNSDSVPVIYTRVKNLKRISGLSFFKVSYHDEKTIFINADSKIIDELS